MVRDIRRFNLSEWVDKISAERILFLSNKDFVTRYFLHGEDYYINTIITELTRRGSWVDIGVFRNKRVHINDEPETKEIDEAISPGTIMILQGLSPFYFWKLKIKKKARIILPVYFLWNRTCTSLDNLRTALGPIFWQIAVDEYLVPSPSVAESLRRMGIFRKLTILPPHYLCPYCKREEHVKKKELLERALPSVVKIVYIGSLIPKRFSLSKVLKTLNRDVDRKYKLAIYTFSQIEEQTFCTGNVETRITCGVLDEREKCRILSDSHVFIAPAKHTTMEPPISVIEAEYHGNIIMEFE